MARGIAIIWGLGGVLAMLAHGITTLIPKSVVALSMPLETFHFVFAVIWVVFMAWTEGYRGFQLKFSPMVASRVHHLAHNPTPFRLLFAPFFCMGFFHGTDRRLAVTWGLTAMIVVFIIALTATPQPWRGLIDLGVVTGLSWGIVSILVSTARAWLNGQLADPELNEETQESVTLALVDLQVPL